MHTNWSLPLICILISSVCVSSPSFAQDNLSAPPEESTEGSLPSASAEDSDPSRAPRFELRLSMTDAINAAMSENLDLRVERLSQESSSRDVVIARAAFDPLFTTSYTMSKFRQPTISFLSGLAGAATGTTVNVNPFVNQVFNVGVSGLLPTGLTYSVTAADSRNDSPNSSFVAFNPSNSTSIRAEVTQPLLKGFGFNSNLADLRVAQNNFKVSRAQLQRLIETTVASVQNAYWDLAFAREDLRVKQEALREAQQLLEINRQKVQVGTATEIDVIDAEANIETQRGGIIDAENVIRRTQDTLLDLLNYSETQRRRGDIPPDQLAPYEDVRVVPTTPLAFTRYPLDLESAIDIALSNREDLRENEFLVDNSGIELRRRKNQALPGLNVTGNWTQQGLDENIGNSIDSLGTFRFYDWSVGVTFEYPIGNRQERNRLAQARNDLASSKLRLQKLRNGVVLEVTQAARDIQSSFQKLQTSRATVRLRREQLEGEKQRLRVGSSTSYQVLQIQNDVLEAQSLELQALVDYKRAITAFESSVGIIDDVAGVTLEE